MTEHDLIYLAGLFDGEGTVGFRSNGKWKSAVRLEVEIKMADEPVIDWLVATFGGSKVSRPQPGHRKHQWRWRVTGKHARKTFLLFRPYLKVKSFDVG